MLIIKDNDFEIMYNRTVIGEAIRVTRGADNMQCGKKKIILDTDIGDDIDDVFALKLLAEDPESQLLGVTTVFRNGKARARMASYVLNCLRRRDVPVFAGADHPLITNPEEIVDANILAREKRDVEGKYYIPQYESEMDEAVIENRHAVEFIAEQARKYGKDVHLVLIGAFTNAALAIRMYPDEMKTIGGITVMGGWFYADRSEWNILCDPEAAEIVFSSGVPIKAVGIDVTSQCTLSRDVLKEIEGKTTSCGELLTNMIKKWGAHYQTSVPIMHDPLAVATLLCDNIVTFKSEKVRVGLSGDERGKTLCCKNGYPIMVAYQADYSAFIEFFKERVLGSGVRESI